MPVAGFLLIEVLKYIITKLPQLLQKRTPPCVLQTKRSALQLNKNILPVPPYGANGKIGVQKNKNLTDKGINAAMWVKNVQCFGQKIEN